MMVFPVRLSSLGLNCNSRSRLLELWSLGLFPEEVSGARPNQKQKSNLQSSISGPAGPCSPIRSGVRRKKRLPTDNNSVNNSNRSDVVVVVHAVYMRPC